MLSAAARGVSEDIREDVPSSSGANRFTIDSNFGVLKADGIEVLVGELTRSTLLPSSRTCLCTGEYKKRVITAAKSPFLRQLLLAS